MSIEHGGAVLGTARAISPTIPGLSITRTGDSLVWAEWDRRAKAYALEQRAKYSAAARKGWQTRRAHQEARNG